MKRENCHRTRFDFHLEHYTKIESKRRVRAHERDRVVITFGDCHKLYSQNTQETCYQPWHVLFKERVNVQILISQ